MTIARDTLLLNVKKSVLQPCQMIEFLGVIVNSKEMALSLLQEKCFGNNRAEPPTSYKRPSFSERDLSTNWETVLFSNCSSSSSPPLQISSNTIDLRISNTQKLRKENPFVTGSAGETAMVYSQSQL